MRGGGPTRIDEPRLLRQRAGKCDVAEEVVLVVETRQRRARRHRGWVRRCLAAIIPHPPERTRLVEWALEDLGLVVDVKGIEMRRHVGGDAVFRHC